jgi:RND superfamily putative drug exporter
MSGGAADGMLAAIASPHPKEHSMATYLYRLGAWSFEHRRRVLMIWLSVLVLIGASAAAFSGRTSDKFSVPGTESQQAQDLLEQKFPGAGGAAARVVYAAPEGERLTDPANRKAMEASLAKAQHAAEVDVVIPPFKAGTITKDGRVAFADVIYPVPADEIDEEARDELAASAVPAATPACRSSSAAAS